MARAVRVMFVLTVLYKNVPAHIFAYGLMQLQAH